MRFISATESLPVLLNGSQNGIEINTAALGFDNELLDFLTEQLGTFPGTGRRPGCHCRTRSWVNLKDPFVDQLGDEDRKSTRLNSSHGYISYAVFCLKKKKKTVGTLSKHLKLSRLKQ